jgi:hypothetical protein
MGADMRFPTAAPVAKNESLKYSVMELLDSGVRTFSIVMRLSWIIIIAVLLMVLVGVTVYFISKANHKASVDVATESTG